MAEDASFQTISVRFAQNVRTLRTFVDVLGGQAQAHDQETFEEFTSQIAQAFGPHLVQLIEKKASLAESQQSEAESSSPERAALEDAIIGEMRGLNKDPSRLRKFHKALEKLRYQPPGQAQILRRSALINLSSYFEWLIADLLNFYYRKYPGALPDTGKALSLSDLRTIGSVAEAEKLLIEREVDSVLRGSIEDQIGYLESRLKVKVATCEPLLPRLAEISQRRNAAIHNGERYGSAYFRKVSPELVKEYGVAEGDIVQATPQYLEESIDLIEIVGLGLLQCSWRRWSKDLINDADSDFANWVYYALVQRRDELAVRLAGLVTEIGVVNDSYLRVISINQCIALKRLGRSQEIENVLARFDWSASALRFQLALSVLRDQRDMAFELIEKARAIDEVSQENLDEWPLFETLRGDDRFAQYQRAEPNDEVISLNDMPERSGD